MGFCIWLIDLVTRRAWALISQEAQITLDASKLGKSGTKEIVYVGVSGRRGRGSVIGSIAWQANV